MLYQAAGAIVAFAAYMGVVVGFLNPLEPATSVSTLVGDIKLSTPAISNVTKLSTSGTRAGLGTIYYQYSTPSSCGPVNPDSVYIAALGNYRMNWVYRAPYCGLLLHVTNTGSNDGVGGVGNSIVVQVADTCEACDENHIDFSLAAWNHLTGYAAPGTIFITWSFCEGCQLSGPSMTPMNEISSGSRIEWRKKLMASGWLLGLFVCGTIYLLSARYENEEAAWVFSF